jgi:hypothetical protein
VRLSGASSLELDDAFAPPYLNEEYPEVEDGLFQDRLSLASVCSSWRAAVAEISAEYLVIHSGKELKGLVKKFEAQKTLPGKPLGEWTLRIDFKILGPYKTSHVLRLLQCTPKLLIYNNRNGPANSPERCTPPEVMKGLAAICSRSLRRLEWSGAGEAPRYQDLVHLCNKLPHLVTLRLIALYSFPVRADGVPPLFTLSKLKTLSLGVIPEPTSPLAEYAVTWDPLVQYLCLHPSQLPCLEHFECDIFPLLSMIFFEIHGKKLRLFRTTAWSAEGVLPEALSLCPNLESLVIAQGSEIVDLPAFHPSIKRICILPTVDVAVSVPQRVFDYAVMAPLDHVLKSIERMVAPHLVELRVRNTGAYMNLVDYSTWLGFWWRRWNIRGVQFRDKAGGSFANVCDRGFSLCFLCQCCSTIFSVHFSTRSASRLCSGLIFDDNLSILFDFIPVVATDLPIFFDHYSLSVCTVSLHTIYNCPIILIDIPTKCLVNTCLPLVHLIDYYYVHILSILILNYVRLADLLTNKKGQNALLTRNRESTTHQLRKSGR